MLVPDGVRRCVAFLELCGRNRQVRLGTAVLVAVPDSVGRAAFVHLVTAKHVIDEAMKTSATCIHARMNSRGGGSRTLEVPLDDWVGHPSDPAADVSAAYIPFDAREWDCTAMSPAMAVTNEIIHRKHIGPGDEVFITGLFAKHAGAHRILPIIRIGNIALMAEEPVQTRLGPTDAFLVEARSIGGLSGSPVFVHISGARTTPTGADLVPRSQFYWLGLIHGHWDIDTTDVAQDALLGDGNKESGFNAGIAIVVPASKAIETLAHSKLVEIHRRIEHGKADDAV